jgi:hypothetical protein
VILRYVPDAEIEGISGLTEELVPSPEVAGASRDVPAEKGPGRKSPAKDPTKDGAGAPRPPTPGAGSTAAGSAQLTAEKLRAAWEGPQKEQINRIVQAIKAALPTSKIEETGDSASMAYGAGGTVAFVREHGVWKIKDF